MIIVGRTSWIVQIVRNMPLPTWHCQHGTTYLALPKWVGIRTILSHSLRPHFELRSLKWFEPLTFSWRPSITQMSWNCVTTLIRGGQLLGVGDNNGLRRDGLGPDDQPPKMTASGGVRFRAFKKSSSQWRHRCQGKCRTVIDIVDAVVVFVVFVVVGVGVDDDRRYRRSFKNVAFKKLRSELPKVLLRNIFEEEHLLVIAALEPSCNV